jgi:hypothetical protein
MGPGEIAEQRYSDHRGVHPAKAVQKYLLRKFHRRPLPAARQDHAQPHRRSPFKNRSASARQVILTNLVADESEDD